ncbi:MAG: plastocyanin [Gammaproteobacteria bacterium RBG_16_57_12]|nr:MAG: plastocyanin [Gammaproteobacteria bacterium RBG_16_57_12]
MALINLLGMLLIALIVWWFWFSKPRAQPVSANLIEILVKNGVYTPARIEVSAGMPLTLRFLRQDPSPCARTVTFDDLAISQDLPLGKPQDVVLTPVRPGEYTFVCEMRMYKGTLVVKPSRV